MLQAHLSILRTSILRWIEQLKRRDALRKALRLYRQLENEDSGSHLLEIAATLSSR